MKDQKFFGEKNHFKSCFGNKNPLQIAFISYGDPLLRMISWQKKVWLGISALPEKYDNSVRLLVINSGIEGIISQDEDSGLRTHLDVIAFISSYFELGGESYIYNFMLFEDSGDV